MADAKQCDRCGKLYPKPIVVSDYRVERYDHPCSGWYRFDFCDDCEADLKKFLNNEDAKGRIKV